MKKRIHVNKQKIAANRKYDRDDAAITVKTYKDNTYGHRVNILDGDGNVVATVVQSTNKPLSCGAVVWIETDNEVEIEP